MKAKQRLQKVTTIAKALILENGTTTTKEIKERLRKEYPEEMWLTQENISKYMTQLVNKNLDYKADVSGDYRIFSYVKPITVKTRTEIVNAIKQSNKNFITILFEKKEGETRLIQCQIDQNKFISDLGYIKCTTKEGIKQVDPKKIMSVRIKGQEFVCKK